jgi:D-alanyl-lipoteichoic acid acyltransferase DltB (MBOAT superfamily)
MSIISIQFFLFILAALIIYYAVPGRFRWAILPLASAFYLIQGGGFWLFLEMTVMIGAAYLCGIWIEKLNGEPDKIKIIATSAVIFEASVLIALKDNLFFVNNANKIFMPLGISFSAPNWSAPMGISYYVLILIGYILDVAWGKIKPQKNFAKFLLFASYFPQMISGPITRYDEMEKTLFSEKKFNYKTFCFGAQRIAWGLFKKLVIAERLAVAVKTVYGNFYKLSGFYIFIAAAGYALQLYADFSACMDIVIGASEMFGAVLPENFKTPFFAKNLSELWRRWHITLGLWVRDYVMYPVLKSEWSQKIREATRKKFGKKAGKQIHVFIGMFATWFTVGFWHGGSWKYIFASGLFFFFLIAGGMIVEPAAKRLERALRINTNCFSWRLFQQARTFMLFACVISIGRAESLTAGLKMWKRAILNLNPSMLFNRPYNNFGLDKSNLLVLAISLLILLAVLVLQQNCGIRERLARNNLIFRWAALIGLIFVTLIFGQYGPGFDPSDFIYRGF